MNNELKLISLFIYDVERITNELVHSCAQSTHERC